MERSSGGPVPSVQSSTTPELVSRTVELAGDVSGPRLLEIDDRRVFWSSARGPTLFGFGVAHEITIGRELVADPDGPTESSVEETVPSNDSSIADRFDRVRERAESCFDRIDYDGPERARPRAFGGFSFHGFPPSGSDPNSLWTDFPIASFVIPEAMVTAGTSGQVLTVTTTEPVMEERLNRWKRQLEGKRLREGNRLREAKEIPTEREQSRSEDHPDVGTRQKNTDERRGRRKRDEDIVAGGGRNDRVIDPDARSATGRLLGSQPPDPDEWMECVEAAVDRIERTALEKVVLAQQRRYEYDRPIDVSQAIDRLGSVYPDCYRFLLDGGNSTYVGATPERLVSLSDRTIETEALAGSMPRGATPEADDRHTDTLRSDPKLADEHDLVVRSIRDGLRAIADSVTVNDRRVRKLATMQHLQTPLSGSVPDDVHVIDAVRTLHPTPAVGGVPTSEANTTIERLEPFDRGWYASPVGWFDATGDGEFAVAIRAALVADETASVFAGNGIVADSDPHDEREEIELKFQSILDWVT